MSLGAWAKETGRDGRRQLRQFRRVCDDIVTGRLRRLVARDADRAGPSFEPRISYSQPIRNSDGADEKRHNIRLARTLIEDRIFAPGDIWSFWHLIGRPAPSRGFRAGRSIVDGELVRDFGGGLCQLAGLLHVVAIRAGLGILESHPHSRDLYTPKTRYAPLGSDAAVAYAYKDLRLENPLDQPVSWRVEVAHDQIRVSLTSPRPLRAFDAEFVRHDASHQRLAVTYRYCPKTYRRELLRIARYRVEC